MDLRLLRRLGLGADEEAAAERERRARASSLYRGGGSGASRVRTPKRPRGGANRLRDVFGDDEQNGRGAHLTAAEARASASGKRRVCGCRVGPARREREGRRGCALARNLGRERAARVKKDDGPKRFGPNTI